MGPDQSRSYALGGVAFYLPERLFKLRASAPTYLTMKPTFYAAILVLAVTTASAAEEDLAPGMSLMDRGAQLFLEGLKQEMAPAVDGLQDLLAETGPSLRNFMLEMGPTLRDLGAQVKDWSVYEAPEILPNGDIIMRRKPEAPMDTPPAGDGAVDL